MDKLKDVAIGTRQNESNKDKMELFKIISKPKADKQEKGHKKKRRQIENSI